MSKIVTTHMLECYLDETLTDAELARVEQELRHSPTLREQLRQIIKDQDRGEHSVGAVWRRQHLTCLSRDQLRNYLLGVLDAGENDFVAFHLQTIGCAFCMANLADLQAQQKGTDAETKQRRKRFLQSSTGIVQPPKKKK